MLTNLVYNFFLFFLFCVVHYDGYDSYDSPDDYIINKKKKLNCHNSLDYLNSVFSPGFISGGMDEKI